MLSKRVAMTVGEIFPFDAPTPVLSRTRDCSLLAHRGYADVAPENTLGAIQTAAPTADAIELDVRLSADGTPVVIHDPDLSRLVGLEASVRDYDATDLSNMTVLGSAEGIPDLRTYIEAVPAGVGLNVEIKEPGAVQPTIDVLNRFEDPVLLSSFETEALATAKDLAPSLPRAYLFGTETPDALTTAIELGCAAVHPSLERCLRTRLVAHAHDAGLQVNVWTVRRRPAAWLLAALGVDGVIADRPVLPGVRRGFRTRAWLGS